MNDESTLSRVVLPEPVPPQTTMFRRAADAGASRSRRSAAVSEPKPIRSSHGQRVSRELSDGEDRPLTASGGMIAFTREPSGRRASTIGLASSQRRPSGATMRSMIRITWSSSSKTMSVSSSTAVALDVDLVRAVDHDLGDGLVVEQRLNRTEGQDVGGDRFEEARALDPGEEHPLVVEQLVEHPFDPPAHLDVPPTSWRGVKLGHQAPLEAALQLPQIRGAPGRWAPRPRRVGTWGDRRSTFGATAGDARGRRRIRLPDLLCVRRDDLGIDGMG